MHIYIIFSAYLSSIYYAHLHTFSVARWDILLLSTSTKWDILLLPPLINWNILLHRYCVFSSNIMFNFDGIACANFINPKWHGCKLADCSWEWPKGSLFNSYSFPYIALLTLDLHLIMLRVKQGDIKYDFLSLWYDSTRDWTLVS